VRFASTEIPGPIVVANVTFFRYLPLADEGLARSNWPSNTFNRYWDERQMQILDDALGDFLVRVTCPCGTSRHIEPEALARLVGRKVTLAALAT